jgi:DNA-binding NtrC family response regulator
MSEWPDLLVGGGFEMRKVRHIIGLVGPRRATVLVTGESGTGKELAAKALHYASPRASGPWVAVNCGALPEHLLEDELFGHVRGAFTNAVQNRIGRFEQANGGTLFLDEIGELPLELQAKLLRVLQEREFQRLGSSETIRADVRVIAATNADLPVRVARREFREDLYYRINVVALPMPPLRDRLSDLPELAGHLLRRICDAERIPLKSLDSGALARLQSYSWPGNVRQLENALEAADALSGPRTTLTADDFPLPEAAAPGTEDSSYEVPLPDRGLDYERTLAGIERGILAQALRRTGGNKKAAADMLGLKRTTLAAKVRSLESMGCGIGY